MKPVTTPKLEFALAYAEESTTDAGSNAPAKTPAASPSAKASNRYSTSAISRQLSAFSHQPNRSKRYEKAISRQPSALSQTKSQAHISEVSSPA
jgi:hypothetical protein